MLLSVAYRRTKADKTLRACNRVLKYNRLYIGIKLNLAISSYMYIQQSKHKNGREFFGNLSVKYVGVSTRSYWLE